MKLRKKLHHDSIKKDKTLSNISNKKLRQYLVKSQKAFKKLKAYFKIYLEMQRPENSQNNFEEDGGLHYLILKLTMKLK